MLQVQEIFSDEMFFRLENHEVKTENGKVIQNWMWTEVPDMVCAIDYRGLKKIFLDSCMHLPSDQCAYTRCKG